MITEEQKTKLWQLIDDYAGAEQVVAISAIYGNGLPEEYDELIRSRMLFLILWRHFNGTALFQLREHECRQIS